MLRCGVERVEHELACHQAMDSVDAMRIIHPQTPKAQLQHTSVTGITPCHSFGECSAVTNKHGSGNGFHSHSPGSFARSHWTNDLTFERPDLHWLSWPEPSECCHGTSYLTIDPRMVRSIAAKSAMAQASCS